MRRTRSFTALFILTLPLLFAPRVKAHETVVVQPPCTSYCQGASQPARFDQRPRPSTFRYGVNGLFAGGIAGLGVGYLFSRDDDRDRARSLGFASGIGALAGAAFGVSLGLLDGPHGGGYAITRDAAYGASFGAVVGALGGSLAMIRDAPREAVAFGAAIGAVSGAGLGLLTGFFRGRSEAARSRASGRALRLSVAPTGDDLKGLMSTISGRF